MLRRLKPTLRLDDLGTTPGIEWAWAIGRLVTASLVLLGSLVLLDDQPGAELFPVVVAAVYAYGAVVIGLLLKGKLRAAFFVGFACDTACVIAAMIAFMSSVAGAEQTNDLYLALFPIIVIGVARLGWALGILYTLLWLGVLTWTSLTYYPATSYDVQQLPVRLLFLSATTLLVMRLVVQVQRERRAEAHRAEAIAQMERLKSALLQSVSHQLKTPLTAVQTASDLLAVREQEMTEEQQGRAVRLLRSGVQRLRMLVQASLEYARLANAPGEIETEDVDLALAAGAVLRSFEETANAKKQTVSLLVAGAVPPVRVDPAHIREILVNLLEASHRLAPEGGEIVMRLKPAGQRVQVEVANNGPCIPDEDREGLFHLYYRGRVPDSVGDAGTGLGLAIAKLLVELYGGSIGYRNGAAGASAFHFALPAVRRLPPQ